MSFLLRNVFTVKTREKVTFVCHMKKTVLPWDSAEPWTPKKRNLDPLEPRERRADVTATLPASGPQEVVMGGRLPVGF